MSYVLDVDGRYLCGYIIVGYTVVEVEERGQSFYRMSGANR